jgi:hypothetical protein
MPQVYTDTDPAYTDNIWKASNYYNHKKSKKAQIVKLTEDFKENADEDRHMLSEIIRDKAYFGPALFTAINDGHPRKFSADAFNQKPRVWNDRRKKWNYPKKSIVPEIRTKMARKVVNTEKLRYREGEGANDYVNTKRGYKNYRENMKVTETDSPRAPRAPRIRKEKNQTLVPTRVTRMVAPGTLSNAQAAPAAQTASRGKKRKAPSGSMTQAEIDAAASRMGGGSMTDAEIAAAASRMRAAGKRPAKTRKTGPNPFINVSAAGTRVSGRKRAARNFLAPFVR